MWGAKSDRVISGIECLSATLRQAMKENCAFLDAEILKASRRFRLFRAICLSPRDKRKRVELEGVAEDTTTRKLLNDFVSLFVSLLLPRQSVCPAFISQLRHFCMPHNRRRTGGRRTEESESRTLYLFSARQKYKTQRMNGEREREGGGEREIERGGHDKTEEAENKEIHLSLRPRFLADDTNCSVQKDEPT